MDCAGARRRRFAQRRQQAGPPAEAAFSAEADRLVEEHLLLLDCDQGLMLDRAADIATRHRVRAMHAVHLAVADLVGRPRSRPYPLHFASGDKDQARAAAELMFPVPSTVVAEVQLAARPRRSEFAGIDPAGQA